jgi:hypothetical protein
MAMACFAWVSSIGLHAGPQLARLVGRIASRGSTAGGRGVDPMGRGQALVLRDNALRLAGVFLLMASAWALGHDIFRRAVAWCLG